MGGPASMEWLVGLVVVWCHLHYHTVQPAFTDHTQDTGADTTMVEVVQGYNASLPCSIHSPPHDTPALTLWYIGIHETPVYSYDQRPNMRGSGWSDGAVFGSRVRYLPNERPPVLMLTNVTPQDARLYRCRVDYHKSNSRQAWVRLTVVVPPTRVEVVPRISLVELGQRDDVVCRVTGGSPPARVVWVQDGRVVDANSTEQDGYTENSLEVPAARHDLIHNFTCRGSNNDVTPPLETFYRRNVTCGPLSVQISVEDQPLVSGRRAQLKCTVVGSNPPPAVTWYEHGTEVTPLHTAVQVGQNVTVSVLTLEVTREHHGRKLVCRAEHPSLPRAFIEDILTLDVAYKPNVSLSLGRALDPTTLKEGIDLFFDCNVDANPPPYKVKWLHEGQELLHNLTAGVVVSEVTLALQKVSRQRAGTYQCVASNVEGDSTSNPVTINILYRPRCAVPPVLRGVALFEKTNVTCSVDADPPNVTFTWTFNNSVRRDQNEVVSPNRYTQEGSTSVLSYTPMSDRDYGTLLCYANNHVGRQTDPCSFTIISAGPPEEVTECSVGKVTSHSAEISCTPGFNGGLPQHFLLQVWQQETARQVVNISSPTPVFEAKPLKPDHTYSAHVIAYNSRGHSGTVTLSLLTLKEAEMHKTSPLSPTTGLPSMVEPAPLVVMMGVIGGVVVVMAVLALTIWCVKERTHPNHASNTVTQIVLNDNNPDLLSVEAADEETGVLGNGSVMVTSYHSTDHNPGAHPRLIL